MKVAELFLNKNTNRDKAKKIRARLKDKAKMNNPGEPEIRGGWSVDPHQGSYNTLRMAG